MIKKKAVAKVSRISPERVLQSRRGRFNPISSLTPASLISQLELFHQGYLSQIARTWDSIERRDDKIAAVRPKRLSALARNGWEILTTDDSPEAEQHAATLKWTFEHLTAINAVDENERGGLSLALRQMGDAIGKRYSVHELGWQPVQTPDGWQMQVEMRHAPLWFFENTTGRLRFLAQENALTGETMEPNEWLVSVGSGLMEACSILYMFKRLPLTDWLSYCELFGIPGIVGHTTSAEDSDAGRALRTAVEAIGAELAFVLYGSDKNAIDIMKPEGGSGQLPFPPLIERCDRSLSALWRGADLSTMSAGAGSGEGASVQGDETELLEQDDAAWASEILQTQIAREVILWKFGKEPLAYIKVKCRQTKDTRLDLDVLGRMVDWGAPIAMSDAAELLGIPLAEEGEANILSKSWTPSVAEMSPGLDRMANILANSKLTDDDAKKLRAYLDAGKARVARGLATDLQPLRKALETMLQADPAQLPTLLANFRQTAPSLFKAIAAGGQTERALNDTLAPALLDGLATKKPSIQ